MNYNEKIFTEQMYILRDFLYHYRSYSVLHRNFDELSKISSQEFWVFTINAHYYQAINLWCMIFGTNKNETHWKKLGLSKEFTPIVLAAVDLTDKEYKNYWESVIEWRNKYSAHRVPNFREDTPDLKLARKVVLLYEEWVSENIDDIISFSLELYEAEFEEEAEELIQNIISVRKV